MLIYVKFRWSPWCCATPPCNILHAVSCTQGLAVANWSSGHQVVSKTHRWASDANLSNKLRQKGPLSMASSRRCLLPNHHAGWPHQVEKGKRLLGAHRMWKIYRPSRIGMPAPWFMCIKFQVQSHVEHLGTMITIFDRYWHISICQRCANTPIDQPSAHRPVAIWQVMGRVMPKRWWVKS